VTLFTFSPQNEAAFILFVKKSVLCVSQHSIFSNTVDLSQGKVLLFGQEVLFEILPD